MFDNFREWLSDRLRYVLLGLAVILIIIVGFFAVKMFKGSDSSDGKAKNDTSSESDTQPEIIQDTGNEPESTTEPESKPESDDLLLQDAYPAVNEIVNKYYTAQTEFDKETLNTIVESLLDEDIAKIEIRNKYIEGYKNISCYTKKGLEDNSYFVFVYYDLKFFNSENLLPGLISLYVCTNDSGQLYISADLNNQDVKSYQTSILENDADIVALKDDVNARYVAALAEHQELDTEMTDLKVALNEDNSQPDSTDTTVQVNKVVSVLQSCNVRADSTTGAEILATLEPGTTITRVQVMDNGWTEVKYGDGKGYIKSEYLSE